MNETIDLINKFEKFTKSEIASAIKELDGIKIESNRKHLQRLVYVNLVNRFDSFVDTLLLSFSIKESEFQKKVLNDTKEEPVFLKDIYEIFLSENSRTEVENRVQGVVRSNYLNQRHSSKLRILLKECFNWSDSDWQRPRVFINNGSIFFDVTRIKPHKIPDTVIGYADWLYSRRNALVHHDKPEITKNDVKYIEEKFLTKLSKSFSLKISSIGSASKFYLDLTESLKKQISSLKNEI